MLSQQNLFYADANWDDWDDDWDEAEQISEAQSSQPADQHKRHKGEHSAHYWSHNTPTTGTAADRRNRRKYAQMKDPEKKTLNNKRKKVRQTYNGLWKSMVNQIAENTGLPLQCPSDKREVSMEQRKATLTFMKRFDTQLYAMMGHSQH